MNFISLFSGIGGFDLAFQRAGMDCVGMVEIDTRCQDVLRRHFPGVPIYNDVKEVGIATHERNSVDLICGGFPCQDLSIAGKRAGLAGERSGLWFEFARIIDELAPRWVVIENVPGLLSSDKGRDFAEILRRLVELRYGVCWRVLDAQYFGVPQRRRRVFVVASLGSGRAAEVLFEREGMFGDIAESGEEGERVAPTISGGAHPGGLNGRDAENGACVAPTLQSHHYRDNADMPYVMAHGQANADMPYVFDRQRSDEYGEMDIASTVSQRDFKGPSDLVNQSGVRRLTPTECERLQGFPDGWTDGQIDSTRYRQLGKAVAVPVVEWIAERIVEASRWT